MVITMLILCAIAIVITAMNLLKMPKELDSITKHVEFNSKCINVFMTQADRALGRMASWRDKVIALEIEVGEIKRHVGMCIPQDNNDCDEIESQEAESPAESFNPDLSEAKKGDMVFHITHGYIVISSIWDDGRGYLSIGVTAPCMNGGSVLYGMDGRYRADDVHPTVFEDHRQAKRYFDKVWNAAEEKLKDTLRGAKNDA